MRVELVPRDTTQWDLMDYPGLRAKMQMTKTSTTSLMQTIKSLDVTNTMQQLIDKLPANYMMPS